MDIFFYFQLIKHAGKKNELKLEDIDAMGFL